MPATHAQEACTSNLCKSSYEYKNLHVPVDLVQVFFWYKFLARVSPALRAACAWRKHSVDTCWYRECACGENWLNEWMNE